MGFLKPRFTAVKTSKAGEIKAAAAEKAKREEEQRQCPRCKGAKTIKHEECGGTGSLKCEDCGGKGGKPCDACSGSGKRKSLLKAKAKQGCLKCRATGLLPC